MTQTNVVRGSGFHESSLCCLSTAQLCCCLQSYVSGNRKESSGCDTEWLITRFSLSKPREYSLHKTCIVCFVYNIFLFQEKKKVDPEIILSSTPVCIFPSMHSPLCHPLPSSLLLRFPSFLALKNFTSEASAPSTLCGSRLHPHFLPLHHQPQAASWFTDISWSDFRTLELLL